MKIKEKFRKVRDSIFRDISIPEYITWWVFRALMLYAVIRQDDLEEKVLAAAITLSLFTITIFRFFSSEKSVLNYLSSRVQTVINVIAFAGSFMGNYICVRDFYSRFDRFLHVLSGSLCVIIGYYIIKAFLDKNGVAKKVSPSVYAIGSMGFSFMVIVLWEIMEFAGDFIFGSNNQGYKIIPDNRDWWYLFFGPGNVAEGKQFPVWDTMLDMTDAAISTIVTTVILFVVLNRVFKKYKAVKQSAEQEVTV